LNFGNGSQNVAGKRGNPISAWAVHDGDVGDILDTDEDGDGLVDIADNCILIPNGPLDPDAGGNSQLDADGDGFGNICDPDFDNNNSVDFADLALLKSKFFTDDPDADLDGNGRVDFADLAILKSMFFNPPGPSGLAPSSGGCVNTIGLNQSVAGNWESTCTSTHLEGSYAKYYTFTLPGSQEVTIDLQSSIDTYLLLLDGSGDNGDVIDLNDDAGNSTNSQIIQTLSAGSYTIEATTYDPGETGAFDLSVR
jgi:hypothetical protein